MHFLDLIMYFVTLGILWFIIGWMTDGEWTEELGGIIGLVIIVVYTILYIVAFAFWPDWNWCDFHSPFTTGFFKW